MCETETRCFYDGNSLPLSNLEIFNKLLYNVCVIQPSPQSHTEEIWNQQKKKREIPVLESTHCVLYTSMHVEALNVVVDWSQGL